MSHNEAREVQVTGVAPLDRRNREDLQAILEHEEQLESMRVDDEFWAGHERRK